MMMGVKYIKGSMQQDFNYEQILSLSSLARTCLELACSLEEIFYYIKCFSCIFEPE